MENHHKEVKFISRSILYSVVRGILVGIGVGLVVVAFRLAIETQKQVIPAVLFNTKKVLPQHKPFFFWPGKIEMHFLPPVTVDAYAQDQSKELKEKVFGSGIGNAFPVSASIKFLEKY